MRWALVAVAVLLAGCTSPPDDGWTPSTVTAGLPRPVDGTFLFLEVRGTLHEQPVDEDSHAICDKMPYDAGVDVAGRRLALPAGTAAAWKPNVTMVVWVRTSTMPNSPSCDASTLVAPEGLLTLWTTGGMQPTIVLSALENGAALGPRVLVEGEPYRHSIAWQERDPGDGRLRHYEGDLVFESHGAWSWHDVGSVADASDVNAWA